MKILFVCTGNICRSPMAEAVMQKMAKEKGLEGQIEIDSAGLIAYHSEEMADERARRELAKHGIDYAGNARQVGEEDFFEFELILGMTREHVAELERLKPEGSRARVELFMDHNLAKKGRDVPDPWYGGNFEEVYEMIESTCRALLAELVKEYGLKSTK